MLDYDRATNPTVAEILAEDVLAGQLSIIDAAHRLSELGGCSGLRALILIENAMLDIKH